MDSGGNDGNCLPRMFLNHRARDGGAWLIDVGNIPLMFP